MVMPTSFASHSPTTLGTPVISVLQVHSQMEPQSNKIREMISIGLGWGFHLVSHSWRGIHLGETDRNGVCL